ncbi:MAG: Asd/ArgC dimerization domain-containing protein [Pseudobdellovibrionaceae bacterium]
MSQTRFILIDPLSPTGFETLNRLSEEGVPAAQVLLYTHVIGATRQVSYGEGVIKVQDISAYNPAEGDIVLNGAPVSKSKSLLQKIKDKGAKCYDLSGIWRKDPDTVFVQGQHDSPTKQLYLPNSVALHLIALLEPLKEAYGLKSVHVTAHVPVALAGQKAQDELFAQTRNIFMNVPFQPQEFPKQIAFNMIPQVGGFQESGQSEAEWEALVDVKRALGKGIAVALTCVYAPVFATQSLSVQVELAEETAPSDARRILSQAGLRVVDTSSDLEFVSPVEVQGEDEIYVSRVREEFSFENTLSLWSVADALRLSAAAYVRALRS